ncbi:hypothetical protein [Streptomyces cucumeris]|uniref:hypothetical protein n=1 Tax=Streptomyces cucumeris TaxID=2962890 RepID=UPI0020C92AEE|nr:hypothetical protein [Streptomyces sp. NEAU-Y11]MCP9210095.1 hypothetical protein [Streptomyces sp. NEAU-Y11]
MNQIGYCGPPAVIWLSPSLPSQVNGTVIPRSRTIHLPVPRKFRGSRGGGGVPVPCRPSVAAATGTGGGAGAATVPRDGAASARVPAPTGGSPAVTTAIAPAITADTAVLRVSLQPMGLPRQRCVK